MSKQEGKRGGKEVGARQRGPPRNGDIYVTGEVARKRKRPSSEIETSLEQVIIFRE